jgi:hypothetical protein
MLKYISYLYPLLSKGSADMPLEIAKSILVTGIGQEDYRAQVSCYDYRNDTTHTFNVTIKDFTDNTLRGALDWRFVVDHTDPLNTEVLENVIRLRNEAVTKSRKEWSGEQDLAVRALAENHLSRSPVYYLGPMGTHPIAIIVGMNVMLYAAGYNKVYVSDAIGRITDIELI